MRNSPARFEVVCSHSPDSRASTLLVPWLGLKKADCTDKHQQVDFKCLDNPAYAVLEAISGHIDSSVERINSSLILRSQRLGQQVEVASPSLIRFSRSAVAS